MLKNILLESWHFFIYCENNSFGIDVNQNRMDVLGIKSVGIDINHTWMDVGGSRCDVILLIRIALISTRLAVI